MPAPDEAAAAVHRGLANYERITLSRRSRRACCKVEVPGDSCVLLFFLPNTRFRDCNVEFFVHLTESSLSSFHPSHTEMPS